MQIHAEHNDTIIKTTRHSLLEKYTSHFICKVCVWEGVGDWTKTATYWPPHPSPDIAVCRSRSPGLLNRRPGGPAFCWVVAFSTTSCHQMDLISKLTDFLSSPNYIIVQSPTQYLWNGMFDRHQAEITVMQLTGHSLPVHQSMTVPWDFTLFHIVSQARVRAFFP